MNLGCLSSPLTSLAVVSPRIAKMGEWETENEKAGNLAAREANRRSSSRSVKSRRRSKTPPNRSISPAVADKAAKRSSRDTSMDESISILDPRRFTPTLHANLVSEILTLRRDQEDKTKLIESLEGCLFSTKEENESLQASFATLSKESRSLKRQLSLLEGGTSSALGELARERDDAVESIAENKKRWDAAQKKIRSLEDESQRVHEQWAKEKDDWEDERRKYDRKIHISETRLKTILDEVAAYQDAQEELNDEPDMAPKENDGASIRTMSMTGSIRYSLLNSPGPANANGACLADELNLDDEDSDAAATESVFSSPRHKRTVSRDTAPIGRRHRRDWSVESLGRPGSAARSRLFFNPNVLGILQGEDEEPSASIAPPPSYRDTGVQFSPPPSPKLEASRKAEAETVSRIVNEIEANQRRKRVQPVVSWPGKPAAVDHVQQRHMVSAAAQTVETPLSPPRTPKAVFEPATPPPEEIEPTMVSAATQTDKPETPVLNIVPPLTPPMTAMPIPSISVQPPTSRPTTPRSPMLPPYMKNFGCQVNISYAVPMVEASVQTEGIQVDKRLATLPPHLQPSAISSRPTSPNKDGVDRGKSFTPVPGNLPPRNPRRLTKTATDLPSSPISMAGDEEDALASYLHHDDVENIRLSGSRRHGGLFAGFETQSSDEAEEFGEVDLSDSEYRTALSAPRPHSKTGRPIKRNSFGMATTSPEQAVFKHAVGGSAKVYGTDVYGSTVPSDMDAGSRSHRRKLSKPLEKYPGHGNSSSRSSDIRKHAMINGSIASQQTRSRSPSLPDGRNPPFPIPLRDSSKRLSSSFMGSPSEEYSPTRADSAFRRGSSSRGSYYGGSVRRVRSATAMPRHQRYRRHGSRSPPPLSVSTEAPESPGLPPLPRNDITTPRGKAPGSSPFQRHRHELSTNTDNTANTDPMSTSHGSHATSVVDAIAQTMVGEWMFKYVRRRKSFSVPDGNGKDDTGNDRHKRWVWLAPYERSILWSSKQPSSGSALMGKTGRKLTIQSVLDVKDDNPVPKGAQTIFNRSILILTPQRALKFTAGSSERHYLWLTALSFLAHSSQAVPENLSAPQPLVVKQPHQQQVPEFEPPQTKARRPGIRDSIRLAKNRTAITNRAGPPSAPSIPSVPSVPSVPSSRMGEVSSSRPPPSTGTASVSHHRETSHDTAEPPMIQRYNELSQTASHGRKRSNTGGQQHVPPPLSFRGFSGPLGSSHDHGRSTTTNTPASSDMFQSQASSNTTWGGSERASEASSRPGNFFDAIGTVRMEAFISPLASTQAAPLSAQDEFRHVVRRRSKDHRRRHSRSRSRNGDGFNHHARGGSGRRGYDDFYGGSRTAGEEEYFRDDPFKGF